MHKGDGRPDDTVDYTRAKQGEARPNDYTRGKQGGAKPNNTINRGFEKENNTNCVDRT